MINVNPGIPEEMLGALLRRAKRALEPFAKIAEGLEDWDPGQGCGRFPTVAQVREAATAFKAIEDLQVEEEPDLLVPLEAYLAAVKELGRTKRAGTSTVNDIAACADDVDTTLDALKRVAREARKLRTPPEKV